MTLPPWFGPPGDGMVAPDPIIWWFIAPAGAYCWALWAALILAHLINTDPNTPRKEGDS